jgi:membrane protease YdiL (CAAX protease family)
MFLQWTSLVAASIVLVTLYFSERISDTYVLSQMRFDYHLFSNSIVFTATLTMFMYIFIKYDKYIIPGIVTKLSQYKSLLFELSTIEKIYLSLLAGISEELLFRGLLQPIFGLTITSILFGMAHCYTFGYFIVATGLGCLFGAALQYSNNLLVPIVVHSLYDIFAFHMLISIYHDMPPNQTL